jgi:hypothetical protein
LGLCYVAPKGATHNDGSIRVLLAEKKTKAKISLVATRLKLCTEVKTTNHT